jgi:hypothetical protein
VDKGHFPVMLYSDYAILWLLHFPVIIAQRDCLFDIGRDRDRFFAEMSVFGRDRDRFRD